MHAYANQSLTLVPVTGGTRLRPADTLYTAASSPERESSAPSRRVQICWQVRILFLRVSPSSAWLSRFMSVAPRPGMAWVEKLALIRSMLNTAQSVSRNDVPWKHTRHTFSPAMVNLPPSDTSCSCSPGVCIPSVLINSTLPTLTAHSQWFRVVSSFFSSAFLCSSWYAAKALEAPDPAGSMMLMVRSPRLFCCTINSLIFCTMLNMLLVVERWTASCRFSHVRSARRQILAAAGLSSSGSPSWSPSQQSEAWTLKRVALPRIMQELM